MHNRSSAVPETDEAIRFNLTGLDGLTSYFEERNDILFVLSEEKWNKLCPAAKSFESHASLL